MRKLNALTPTLLTVTVWVALAALGSGCDSPLSDMTQMKNNTNQMAGTTSTLTGQTGQLLKSMSVLQTDTSDTYFGLRQGYAVTTRADALKKMNEATTVEAKISFATIYFEGFEFMVWSSQQVDTLAMLDGQYLQAIQEFDRDVTQYVPADPSNIDPTSTDNSMENLYALSVSMHMTNELEIDQPVLPNDDPSRTGPYKVSMFDLIKSSLRAENAVYKGLMADSQETDWQQEGAANDQLFEALIQTRENFLAVMTLAKVADISDSPDSSLVEKILGKFDELKKEFIDWDSEIPNLNIEKLDQYDTWVAESNNDRDFLKSIGAQASIDSRVIKIFSKMNNPGAAGSPSDSPKGANADSQAAATQRTQAAQQLWNDIQDMIKG